MSNHYGQSPDQTHLSAISQELISNNVFTERDIFFQGEALQLAKHAEKCGEVPVGAVVVLDNEIIGEGYNQPISANDPTAHAEIIALRAAAEKIQNYRLVNAKLYVTLEPCLMCAAALVHARIAQVIFGAHDLRAGAIETQLRVLEQPFLNHKVSYAGGLLADDCRHVLQEFFKKRR